MSKNAKIVLWVIVILVVLGIVWWVYAMNMNSNNAVNSGAQSGYYQTTTSNSTTTTTISPGNSNANLNQDMSKVDAQMNGLNSDSANAQSTNGNY